MFWEGSYGYRPGRSAQDAIRKVKEYAEKGYAQAVLVDLSKYFDTLNHELLMNLLRKNIHDKRVIELIKRYLKAGCHGKRTAGEDRRRFSAGRTVQSLTCQHLPE